MLKYVSQFHFKFGVGPCHEPVTVLFVRGFPLILFSVGTNEYDTCKGQCELLCVPHLPAKCCVRQAKLSLGDVFYVASVGASLLGSHLVVSPTSLFQMRQDQMPHWDVNMACSWAGHNS